MVGIIVIGIWTGLSLLGLRVFNKFSDPHSRHKDTETVGLTSVIVVMVYAVLIGFIVVNVFEAYAKGDEIATTEANALGNLAFETAGPPAGTGLKLREDIDKYIDIVVNKEWPAQQAYQMQESNFEDGWNQVCEINTVIAAFEPATLGQTSINADMVRLVNELYAARRPRVIAASTHLPFAVWEILIFGLLLVAVFIYLYGPHSFGAYVAVTGLTMLSIGLVFTLIIALD